MQTLMILIDGVGYDQLLRHQPPGLTALGARLGMAPVRTLLSFSSGIYCSLWSGLYPDEHGVWTEFYRGRDGRFRISSLFRLLPGRHFPRWCAYLLGTALVRLGWKTAENFSIPPRLQSHFRRIGSDYRLFPPAPAAPAPAFEAQLLKIRPRWKYIYRERLDFEAWELLEQAGGADTVILALPEMDEAGHEMDPEGEAYRRRLMEFDRRLAGLLESLQRAQPGLRLSLFSDHAMNRVERAFDGWAFLEQGGFRLGRDYLAFINSTMILLWFDRGRREEIILRLNRSGAGHVLTDAERSEFHLNFRDNKFGDEIFLADVGVELVPNFINLARRKGCGMHGYDPRAESTRAFFIGEKTIGWRPADIMDLHRVLEEGLLSGSGGSADRENHVQP